MKGFPNSLCLAALFQWSDRCPVPTSPTELPASPDDLEAKLQTQLLTLSVRAYERLVAQVLCASGYEDVQILRDHTLARRSHKGRTTHGGVDITAKQRAEFGVTPILVQVKQYTRPVSRRFVDELRGALLRTQARQGVLITTSTFAKGARKAALEDHIGPISLIDGAQLRALILTHRLGIKRNRRGRLRLHSRFFKRLDKSPSPEISSVEIISTSP